MENLPVERTRVSATEAAGKVEEMRERFMMTSEISGMGQAAHQLPSLGTLRDAVRRVSRVTLSAPAGIPEPRHR
jgi:hypothetical protein